MIWTGSAISLITAIKMRTGVLPRMHCRVECRKRQEDIRRVRQLLETLPARERQILLLRYGLAGQPPMTQLEAARILGISRSYISRLETHALDLLRQKWTEKPVQN